MGAGKEAQQVKVFATQTWSSEKGGKRESTHKVVLWPPFTHTPHTLHTQSEKELKKIIKWN